MAKILVVDDEFRIRQIIRKYAEFEGYEVEEAVDGMQAIEICRQKEFDLIIMDVMMPELDGFSACREIRAFCDAPVIFLTALGEEENYLSGFGAGAGDFEGRANLLRATIGESGDAASGRDEVCEIKCNIDDMTGEALAYACERIFEAGALDVLTIPAVMKKGRPGVVLDVLCTAPRRDGVVAAVFRHTSTIGVRECVCRRSVLSRREETVTLSDGSTVRRKISEGFGVVREKFEHDDIAAYATRNNIPLDEAFRKCFCSRPVAAESRGA